MGRFVAGVARWAVGLTLASGALGSGVGAQVPAAQDSAERMLRLVFEAQREHRWADLVALVDSASVRASAHEVVGQFRRMQASVAGLLELPDSLLPPGTREMLARDGDGWQDAMSGRTMLRELYGVDSLPQLEAMSDAALLARQLESRDVRRMSHIPPRYRDRTMPERRILGSVIERDTLVHVLYEAPLDFQAPAQRAIATVVRTTDGWRLRRVEHDHTLPVQDAGVEWSAMLGGRSVAVMGSGIVQSVIADGTARRVTWRRPGLPDGAAWLEGGTLVVELPTASGPPTRIEIPADAVAELVRGRGRR